MIRKGVTILIIFVLISLLNISTVAAAINTISQGNIIFVGEEGLDVSAAMGPHTQIGWWASAADIKTTSPTKTLDLTNRITGFLVSQHEFSGYLGNWYRLNSTGKADGAAFNVADPQLDIKAEDTTVKVDVETLKWIPTGDDIRFRIDTNLAQMAAQRSSPPLITIKVQSPEGGIYTSLFNAGGIPTSVVNIPVTTTPFYTGSIWNMGNRDVYSPGTYVIWAECNVNKMNDNYGVTGKTMSRQITLLNQERNPLITKTTTMTTTQVTTLTESDAPSHTVVITIPPPRTSAASHVPTDPDVTTPPQTQAARFEATLGIPAIVIGLVLFLIKE